MSDVHTIMQVPVYERGLLVGYADVWHDDYADIVKYLWKRNPQGYPCRYSKAEGTVKMHRQIMGLGHGNPLEVDHVDRNPMNNRRSNLRVVTHAQNQQNRGRGGGRNNTSGFRGVSFDKRTQRWAAYAVLNGERHWMGRHETAEAAAEVAREFRLKHMTHNDADRTAEPDHQSLYRIRESHS
jgi:hypothetical protein